MTDPKHHDHRDSAPPESTPPRPQPLDPGLTGGAGGGGGAAVPGPGGQARIDAPTPTGEPAAPSPRRTRTRRRVRPEDVAPRGTFTPRERLLLLDTWMRSKLPAQDFSALVGVSQHTLYKWRQRFEEEGPAGLRDRKRGRPSGSRLSEEVKRAILMMKQSHPDWGQDRIHSMLMRSEGFAASPGAIGRYLEQEGYVVEDVPTKPHPDKVRHFERARPNQLWQTDLFTFVLKRENRRVHLCAFMDDHSRFVVGYGLHASSSGALVREVFEAGIANYGAPEEVLTDNGTQYHTWRGKSAFRKLLERRGIKQVVASPRRPQTLGKIERFWGTLWRECVEAAIFRGLDDARQRIGLFIDHYNFQRPHSGIDGLVPADRYFAAAPQVLEALRARVAANAKDLAQHGTPRKAFYLTGRVGDESVSLHAEGERVILTKEGGQREEVDLAAPGRRADDRGVGQELPPPSTLEGPVDPGEAPGTSPLDAALADLRRGLSETSDGDEDAGIEDAVDEGDDAPESEGGP